MLSRIRTSGILFGLAIAAAFPAASQPPHSRWGLTEIPGLLECRDYNLGQCIEDNQSEFLEQHPGAARYEKNGITSVRLRSGAWLAIKSEWSNCWRAMNLQLNNRYLALHCLAEEFGYWKLVDLNSGRVFDFDGFPYLSPDGRHIVVAKQNEMEGHILDMFDFVPAGVERVFGAKAEQQGWFPNDVCWVDNDTVAYQHSAFEGAGNTIVTHPERLKYAGGAWRLSATSPAEANRCTDRVG